MFVAILVDVEAVCVTPFFVVVDFLDSVFLRFQKFSVSSDFEIQSDLDAHQFLVFSELSSHGSFQSVELGECLFQPGFVSSNCFSVLGFLFAHGDLETAVLFFQHSDLHQQTGLGHLENVDLFFQGGEFDGVRFVAD